jgi:hypothetical protein
MALDHLFMVSSRPKLCSAAELQLSSRKTSDGSKQGGGPEMEEHGNTVEESSGECDTQLLWTLSMGQW